MWVFSDKQKNQAEKYTQFLSFKLLDNDIYPEEVLSFTLTKWWQIMLRKVKKNTKKLTTHFANFFLGFFRLDKITTLI